MDDLPIFHKVKVEEHELIKDWFLENYQDYIDDLGIYTDFFICQNNDPPYKKEWEKFSKRYIEEFSHMWGVKKYSYKMWCAQYSLGNEHEWHIHPGSHFAVVYNLELPHNQNSTELWKKHYPAEEGEMIFFPSFWIHRSAPHLFNQRKTVIAGNLTFMDHAFLP